MDRPGEPRDTLDLLEFRDPWEELDHKGHRGQWDQEDPSEEPQVQRVHKERWGHQGP